MTPLPVSGAASASPSPEGSAPAPAGDRREMERFGLMLWLALAGPARSGAAVLGPGAGSAGSAPSYPEGADPGTDRSLGASSARTAASRTATTEALIRGGEPPTEPRGVSGAGEPARSRDAGDRAARGTSADAASPAGGKGGDGTPPAAAAPAETGRGGRGGETAAGVRAVRGVAVTAEGIGRNQAAAAYRALLPGTAKGAAAPAANTAAFTKLLQAQAARLAGTGTRGSGTLSFTFQDALGAQGRVRLALRGGILQTTIVSTSSETVQALGKGIGELRAALAGHGFAESQITVREARPQDIEAPIPDPRDERGRDGDGQPHRRHGDDTPSERADVFRVADEEV